MSLRVSYPDCQKNAGILNSSLIHWPVLAPSDAVPGIDRGVAEEVDHPTRLPVCVV